MARNKYPEETVEAILNAAYRLFLEKGYDNASLQDITDATGLSKGAIYHHFKSKEDIFLTICGRIGAENARILGEIRDDKSLTGLEKLQTIFRAALSRSHNHTLMNMRPYLLRNPRFLALQIQDIYQEVAPRYIQPILEQGAADGTLSVAHPKEAAEAIMLLANVWLNPLLLPTTEEEVLARGEVFLRLMEGLGIQAFGPGLVDAYLGYVRPPEA